MELRIEHVGHVGAGQEYRDQADIAIPLSTRVGSATLDMRIQEEVVEAGTPGAFFQVTVTIQHRVNNGEKSGLAILLQQAFRSDELGVDEEDRLRHALHVLAKPNRIGEGCLNAETWARLAQSSARKALCPDFVADGSWSWDEHGPILPGEPGTPVPGSVAALIAEREKGDAT